MAGLLHLQNGARVAAWPSRRTQLQDILIVLPLYVEGAPKIALTYVEQLRLDFVAHQKPDGISFAATRY